jgi:Zn-dependent peptidase ImmA (M78 family)/transcriptional regulator with XRE-family HTH domain
MAKKISSPNTPGGVGALIRKQREAVRMTVARLAERIGVSRNTVTNYEAGKTEPTAGDLVRLSKALGCSINNLLQSDTASSPSRFAFRAHKGLKKDPSVLVTAGNFLRFYGEIEEITETRLCNRLRSFVCDSDGPLNDREIEGLADDLRQSCGLHDSGPENIASVLESLGVRCLFFDFDSSGLDGISAVQGDMMLTMLKDRQKNVERIIFSGAHELGHLVLHPQLFTADEEDKDDSREFEKEANKFAGYFLVPSNELTRIWREDRLHRLPLFHALLLLKRVFHVSYWCLFYRVKSLGLTKVDYPALIAQTKDHLGIEGRAKVEELEPEPLESKKLYRTTRFQLLIRSAFVQGLIGVSKVAEMLQMPVEHAQEKTTEWLRPNHELVDDSPVRPLLHYYAG